jgi:hypothetical protein
LRLCLLLTTRKDESDVFRWNVPDPHRFFCSIILCTLSLTGSLQEKKKQQFAFRFLCLVSYLSSVFFIFSSVRDFTAVCLSGSQMRKINFVCRKGRSTKVWRLDIVDVSSARRTRLADLIAVQRPATCDPQFLRLEKKFERIQPNSISWSVSSREEKYYCMNGLSTYPILTFCVGIGFGS